MIHIVAIFGIALACIIFNDVLKLFTKKSRVEIINYPANFSKMSFAIFLAQNQISQHIKTGKMVSSLTQVNGQWQFYINKKDIKTINKLGHGLIRIADGTMDLNVSTTQSIEHSKISATQ